MSIQEKFTELEQRNKLAEAGGGSERIAKQHAAGKLTARERIAKLLDSGTFGEIGKFITHQCRDFGMNGHKFLGDGVVTGYGEIAERPVFTFAQDFTVLGGSASYTHTQKICRVMDLALKCGAPIVGLNESGGARIQEGIKSLDGYAEVGKRIAKCSGVVPQISAIMGPSTGGGVYTSASTDFIIMVQKTSYMFITGPEVVRAVIHESVTKEQLGGPEVHAAKSGVCHFLVEDEEECFHVIRELLSFLPQNNSEDPPIYPGHDDPGRKTEHIKSIIPPDPKTPYDMHSFIEEVVDDGYFLEVQARFAQNILIGFARLDRKSVGIVANQPMVLAGCLDIDASNKAARFIRFCDTFNIPILTFVDVAGYLPGTGQEHRGIIRHGSKLGFAYTEATVPKITLVTRKAYGGGYGVMGSRPIGGDIILAYPTAEIAVMGAEGAVDVLYGRKLMNAANKAEMRKHFSKEYASRFGGPYQAAELGTIDGVILAEDTRETLIKHLRMLCNKREFPLRKKHANIPL